MVGTLTRNWWMWLLRGIAAIVFGILAWLSGPVATWIILAIFFGAYALVDGILAIIGTIRAAEAHERWWPFLLEGVVGIVIAAITFYDVRITIFALYFTIAAWAFLTGIFEIVAAAQLRKHIPNEIWMIVGGIASIAFGVLMVWFPLVGLVTITWLIEAYAIVFGIVMIGFSLRLRGHEPTVTTTTAAT